MKLKSTISLLSSLLLLSGCDSEKDLIIIDGDLPIKTSTLYMVGDATPNGWSIDAPTPLVASEDDPLVFTWEGPLNPGEMKLCLTTGSWDSPFIRPQNAGDEIGKNGVPETPFKMHAGDPDDKWRIVDAGTYSLRFDLRNWTMSATYTGEQEETPIEPIETETLYMVGDATPNGWNIDDPTALEKKSQYIFVYEGPLNTGEIKACTTPGSWDVPFIRPTSDGCAITTNGVADENFTYCNAPDYKWKVGEPGIYRLTFNLENWKVAAEYIGEYKPAPVLYMIGDATDGGWSWDAATVIEAVPGSETLFVWEGELGRGT
ncbi:MAG: SusF/SusE family outer membrane protein, partial [Muribaculum sp.]|nr:SusF/SusE family outer membrane protein [Muribaculum sp.]